MLTEGADAKGRARLDALLAKDVPIPREAIPKQVEAPTAEAGSFFAAMAGASSL